MERNELRYRSQEWLGSGLCKSGKTGHLAPEGICFIKHTSAKTYSHLYFSSEQDESVYNSTVITTALI